MKNRLNPLFHINKQKKTTKSLRIFIVLFFSIRLCLHAQMPPPVVNIRLEKKTDTTISLKWPPIIGSKYLVAIKKSSDFQFILPQSGKSYFSDSAFGKGMMMGAGNYCVYDGIKNTITITNLTPNTEYDAIVYTYNNNGVFGSRLYNQSIQNNFIKITTLSKELIDSTDIIINNIDSTSISLKIIPSTEFGELYVMKKIGPISSISDNKVYNHSTKYGDHFSRFNYDDAYVVYNNYPPSFPIDIVITNLQSGTEYEILKYKYNTGEYPSHPALELNTLNYTSSPIKKTFITNVNFPTTQAHSINITEKKNNSATITWERGSGEKCIVVLSKTPNYYSLKQKTNYNADSLFSRGDSIKNEEHYVIYNGTDTCTKVYNLSANSFYRAVVYEYKIRSDNTPAYNLIRLEPNSSNSCTFYTLSNKPDYNAKNINYIATDSSVILFFKKGNGAKRLVKIGIPGEIGEIEDATPYNANSTYGYGTAITANDYVVYDGDGDTVKIKGLEANYKYEIHIYEYNPGLNPSSNQYKINTRNFLNPTIVFLSTREKLTTSNENEIKEIKKFNVYPNPCKDELNFVLHAKNNQATILLQNQLGQNILQKQAENGINKIDLKSFAKGIYYLKIIADSHITTEKIIIE